ncbi:MAG: HIRAN domain-containing protein [Saccharofermentanales bacterium]
MNKTGAGLSVPQPFERDIFLFDTYVAGTTHVENIQELAEKLLIGDKLTFKREPNNKFDPQAIRIQTMDNQKVGYVPRKDNVVFSRLMDAGKLLFAKIKDKEMRGTWLRLNIKIFLHET